jgi:hypothetical protein
LRPHDSFLRTNADDWRGRSQCCSRHSPNSNRRAPLANGRIYLSRFREGRGVGRKLDQHQISGKRFELSILRANFRLRGSTLGIRRFLHAVPPSLPSSPLARDLISQRSACPGQPASANRRAGRKLPGVRRDLLGQKIHRRRALHCICHRKPAALYGPRGFSRWNHQ